MPASFFRYRDGDEFLQVLFLGRIVVVSADYLVIYFPQIGKLPLRAGDRNRERLPHCGIARLERRLILITRQHRHLEAAAVIVCRANGLWRLRRQFNDRVRAKKLSMRNCRPCIHFQHLRVTARPGQHMFPCFQRQRNLRFHAGSRFFLRKP